MSALIDEALIDEALINERGKTRTQANRYLFHEWVLLLLMDVLCCKTQ